MNQLPRLSSFFLCLLLAAALLNGCAAPKQFQSEKRQVSEVPKVRSQPYQNFIPGRLADLPSGRYHVVLPKETLWRISKTYGVPMKSIMVANDIEDGNQLQIGQWLYIPGVRGYPKTPRPRVPLFKKDPWKYIVVHHTATPNGDARSLDRLHLKRGWKNGLGYHFVIDNGTYGRRDGEIEVGRRWYRQIKGAHAKTGNMNQVGIGVALVGNFSRSRVSEEQYDSLKYLVKTLQTHYGIPSHRVLGHRHVPGAATECPGNYFPWEQFKDELS